MSRNSRMPTRLWMVGLGAALGGLVAGFALVLFTPSESTSGAEPAASMADITLSETPEPSASEPAPANAETSPEPESELDPGTGSTLDEQVAACVDAVARADTAVDAARTALGNWKTHYGAQIALDDGEIDGDEAKRRWAESKAPAQDNVDAFTTARRDLPEDDPCAELDVASIEESARRPTEHCIARAAAVPEVMDAAKPSLDDWRGHLEMMATKDQYPIDEYLEIWRQTVADAPGPMRTFEQAADAYDEIGACSPDLAALDR